MSSERPTYLIAGHTTRDLIDSGWRLGGSVVYSTIAARRLNLTTRLVTAHARGLSAESLLDVVSCVTQDSAETTTFRNVERGRSRIQFLTAQGDPLSVDSLPGDWRRPDILHLAPVFQEVDVEFASWFSPGLRCATLQGWLRDVRPNGRVIAAPLPDVEGLLSLLDIAVFSDDDINHNMMWRESIRRSVPLSVETLGAGGCLIFASGREHHVATDPITVSDATGAGDIFATAFFAEYFRTGNAIASGRFANRFTRAMLLTDGFRDVLVPTDSVKRC